jgi:ethanolamine ammonia-lyase small subunit
MTAEEFLEAKYSHFFFKESSLAISGHTMIKIMEDHSKEKDNRIKELEEELTHARKSFEVDKKALQDQYKEMVNQITGT